MKRRTIVAVAVLVALALVVLLVVRWLDDGPRARLEAILSDALGRDVSIGALDVDVTAGVVELRDVTVANPEAVPGPPFLRAGRLRLEISLQELLGRRLVGRLQARDVDLRIVRFVDGTNLEGLLPTPAQRRPDRPPPQVQLDYEVEDGRILLEDLERAQQLSLDGVRIDGRVSNRDRTPLADARVAVDRIELGHVRLRSVELLARASEQGVALPSLRGIVGEAGRMSGSGHLDLRGGNAWSFELGAEDVALDEDITPIVQRFVPVLVAAATADEPAAGVVGAELRLAGRGLAWESIAPTLEGAGRLTVRDLVVPADAVLVSLGTLAGREAGPWAVGEASASFAIDDGWIELSRLEVDEEAISVPVSGRVSFEGALDLKVDLLPLVRAFGGGVYEEVARWTTSIPVRVGGTLQAPEVRPPTVRDLTGSVGGAILRRAEGASGTRGADGL
jgi:hypothetical protein